MIKNYYIHDNGARPFKVTIKNKKAFVSVINEHSGENGSDIYDPIIRRTLGPLEFSFIKEFIGIKGNSILFQVKSDKEKQFKYIYVGSEIFQFYTKEKIEKYNSPIGNNDVSYPYAISKSYIYLMTEKVILNKNEILTKDPYDHYYSMDNKITGLYVKNFRKKILVKRLGSFYSKFY